MTRTLVLALILAPFLITLPLLGEGEGPDPEAAQKAVTEAEAAAEVLRLEMGAAFLRMMDDFDIVMSDDWAGLSPPFQDALKKALDSFATEKGKGLAEDFAALGILSEGTAKRLSAALLRILTEKLAGETKDIDPDVLLKAAVREVYPEEYFEDCWDKTFQDLPVLIKYREAEQAVVDAKEALEAAQAAAAEAAANPTEPPNMILIPRGRFQFGPWSGWEFDLKQNKQSKVRLDAYYIDTYEVSNAEFAKFLTSLKEADRESHRPDGFKFLEDGTVVIVKGTEKHPVRGVTLTTAEAYAEFVKKRLPTEEEWEMAARGAKGNLYPWGMEWDAEATNWKGRGLGRPTAGGASAKDVSPFGVFDMAGNVSEITATLAGRETRRGKLKATDAVVYRGGNYHEGKESAAANYRWTMPAISGTEPWVGFRLVISEKEWKKRLK